MKGTRDQIISSDSSVLHDLLAYLAFTNRASEANSSLILNQYAKSLALTNS